jgi:hypothetical protein
LGEITAVKNAGFKFLEIGFFFTISDVIVLYVKVIFRHLWVGIVFVKRDFYDG